MNKSEEEVMTDEANRLLKSWLFTSKAKLECGSEVNIALAEETGLLRLCMDLSKRAPRKRTMTINPDDLRPAKTAKESVK